MDLFNNVIENQQYYKKTVHRISGLKFMNYGMLIFLKCF